MTRYSPRTGSVTAIAPPWLLLLGYLLLLLVVQSLLSRLLDPLGVPPPDLFLLTGAAFAWRWRPIPALLSAYGVGLLQDVLGAGVLGFHAAGVAGGALLVLGVRRWLPNLGPVQLFISVLAAIAGQWVAFMILTYWLRSELVTFSALMQIVPMLFLTTLVAALLWEWIVRYAFGGMQDGLE